MSNTIVKHKNPGLRKKWALESARERVIDARYRTCINQGEVFRAVETLEKLEVKP